MYGLGPSEYNTASGVSFDCTLKHTQVKLELLYYYNQLFMIQHSICGGPLEAVSRYSKAYSHTTLDYNQNKPYSWTTHLDANNL